MRDVPTDPRKPTPHPPHCTFLAARLTLIMFFGIANFEPCFESFNFYQNKLKIKLFLQNDTNFSRAGGSASRLTKRSFPIAEFWLRA